MVKENIDNILADKKIKRLLNDRRIIVFSICLLIATTLWFLNALSKEYETELKYPIKYVNVPKAYALEGKLPKDIKLVVKGYGFALLRHKMSFSLAPVILNIQDITRSDDQIIEHVTIDAQYIINAISSQVSSEANIIGVKPNRIAIDLVMLSDEEIDKLEQEEDQLAESNEEEDENKKRRSPIDKIKKITPITIKNLFSSNNEEKLEEDIQEEKLEVKEEVTGSKFIKKSVKVDITVENLPPETEVKLFPSKISVDFLVNKSLYDSITSIDFKATVDYNSIRDSVDLLNVSIEEPSKKIYELEFTPKQVEYLIEK